MAARRTTGDLPDHRSSCCSAAEDHHQQYLLKNPHGYRCHSATGIKVPSA
jgi:peptide methionine sulfoxide reductase MsrA